MKGNITKFKQPRSRPSRSVRTCYLWYLLITSPVILGETYKRYLTQYELVVLQKSFETLSNNSYSGEFKIYEKIKNTEDS